MSLAEIEAQLPSLSAEELRRLALESWRAFVERESVLGSGHECVEEDPSLLAALEEALLKADANPGQGLSAAEVRTRLGEWSSR